MYRVKRFWDTNIDEYEYFIQNVKNKEIIAVTSNKDDADKIVKALQELHALQEEKQMKNNFECAYISIGGTMCLYFDTNIIDNTGDSKCEFCIMNNNCEYCLHELMQHRENCINCNIKERLK